MQKVQPVITSCLFLSLMVAPTFAQNPVAEDGAAEQSVGIMEAFPDKIQAKLESRDQARRQLPRSIHGMPMHSVFEKLSLWDPGQTVTVSFRGGDDSLYSRIEDAAREWTRHGNLKLSFRTNGGNGEFRKWTTSDTTFASDIRISFDQPGYWSLVGMEGDL